MNDEQKSEIKKEIYNLFEEDETLKFILATKVCSMHRFKDTIKRAVGNDVEKFRKEFETNANTQLALLKDTAEQIFNNADFIKNFKTFMMRFIEQESLR